MGLRRWGPQTAHSYPLGRRAGAALNLTWKKRKSPGCSRCQLTQVSKISPRLGQGRRPAGSVPPASPWSPGSRGARARRAFGRGCGPRRSRPQVVPAPPFLRRAGALPGRWAKVAASRPWLQPLLRVQGRIHLLSRQPLLSDSFILQGSKYRGRTHSPGFPWQLWRDPTGGWDDRGGGLLPKAAEFCLSSSGGLMGKLEGQRARGAVVQTQTLQFVEGKVFYETQS